MLAPLQFGVAVPGGTEQMSHGARMLLAQHPDWVCLSADARNAYGALHERSAAAGVRATQAHAAAVRAAADDVAGLRGDESGGRVGAR